MSYNDHPDVRTELLENGLNKDFVDHYIKYLLPLSAEFKLKRDALDRKGKRLAIIAFIACILLTTVGWYYGNVKIDSLGALIGAIFIPMFISAIPFILTVNKYDALVESIVYPNIYSYFGNSFTYKANGNIKKSLLLKSGLIEKGKIIQHDYVTGEYKKSPIEISKGDVIYTHITTSDTKLFSGFFILLSFNRRFNGQTIVINKRNNIKYTLNTIFNSDIINTYKRRFNVDKIHLGNPEFENIFDVYSANQFESRDLLTDSLIEKLININNDLGSGVSISFYDQTILIMVPFTKKWKYDLSNDGNNESTIFIDECNQILLYMENSFKLIEYLNLD